MEDSPTEITNGSKNTESEVISNQQIKLPPVSTIITVITLILLFYALFSGETYKFYASFLFLFYSWTKRIWVSVVLLGVFQTLLMIPFRIINLRRSLHIKEFEDKLEQIQGVKKQRSFLKQAFGEGNINVLWYVVNFFIQIISYFSIGRLFLIDFYNQPLNPKLLYSFVSYPEYPILDTYFKIPYPVFNKTLDFGLMSVLIFWIIAFVYKFLVNKFKPYYRQMKKNFDEKKDKPILMIEKLVKNTSGSVILLMIIGWFLMRYFPVDWTIKIFSGDVSHPYSTFNAITAIMTFFIVIWLDFPKINKKVDLAIQENIDINVIAKIKVKLYRESFQKALFLGLGAYFITNQIPCAFELSIFTFETISLLSPLTIDRIIFKIPR